MRLSKTQIAELFRVSTRQLTRWMNDGLQFEKTGNKISIDVYDAHAFLLNKQRGEFLGNDDEGELLELDLERARLAKSQRAKLDIGIAEMKKDLVSKEQITSLITNVIIRNKTHLTKLAPTIAGRLNLDREQAQMIQTMVENVLEEMCVPSWAVEEDKE